MYKSVSEIRAANKRAGFHFFDKETMRFFDSVVYKGVYRFHDGALFITSEQFHGSTTIGPRRYTVRCAYANGDITTRGEFQEYSNFWMARDYARRTAKNMRADYAASTK